MESQFRNGKQGRAKQPIIPFVSFVVASLLFAGLFYQIGGGYITPSLVLGAVLFTVGIVIWNLVELNHACDSSSDSGDEPDSIHQPEMATITPESPNLVSQAAPQKTPWYQRWKLKIKNFFNPQDDKLIREPEMQNLEDETSVANLETEDLPTKSRTPEEVQSAELNKYYTDPNDKKVWRVIERRGVNTKIEVNTPLDENEAGETEENDAQDIKTDASGRGRLKKIAVRLRTIGVCRGNVYLVDLFVIFSTFHF